MLFRDAAITTVLCRYHAYFHAITLPIIDVYYAFAAAATIADRLFSPPILIIISPITLPLPLLRLPRHIIFFHDDYCHFSFAATLSPPLRHTLSPSPPRCYAFFSPTAFFFFFFFFFFARLQMPYRYAALIFSILLPDAADITLFSLSLRLIAFAITLMPCFRRYAAARCAAAADISCFRCFHGFIAATSFRRVIDAAMAAYADTPPMRYADYALLSPLIRHYAIAFRHY